MNKRTLLVTVVVFALVLAGASLLTAQATCQDPDTCPLGLQNGPRWNDDTTTGQQFGPMRNGRSGAQPNGQMGGGRMGNAQQNGQMGGGRMGNAQQNGQMGVPANGCGGQFGSFACLPPAVDGELSSEVIASMTAGYMDEVNAIAVYDGIIDQFGALRPFVNIEAAEAQHIDAWTFLFDRYGVPLPDASPTINVPQFATTSEACQFALDAEVGNAALYDSMLATFDGYPDITQVVTSLRDASEQNHLAALQNCIAR